MRSLTKTAGGKDIWMITIGTQPASAKPAIAVVGGVEGHHLLGAELALGFAENLLDRQPVGFHPPAAQPHHLLCFSEYEPGRIGAISLPN